MSACVRGLGATVAQFQRGGISRLRRIVACLITKSFVSGERIDSREKISGIPVFFPIQVNAEAIRFKFGRGSARTKFGSSIIYYVTPDPCQHRTWSCLSRRSACCLFSRMSSQATSVSRTAWAAERGVKYDRKYVVLTLLVCDDSTQETNLLPSLCKFSAGKLIKSTRSSSPTTQSVSRAA